jgi:hypothetical protein
MTGPISSLTPAPIIGVTAPTSFSLPPGPPQHDVIEWLPEERKDLFRKLRQRATDAHRLIPEFEQIREASMAKIDAANSLKRLTDHPQDFGRGLSETDPLAVAAQKHLDKMTADYKRLTGLQEVRTAAWQAASQALAACEAWLRDGRPHGTVLEDFDGPEPMLAKGESGLLDAVENRRRRGRELKADLHRIRSAPFPSSYCKAQMRAEIEALAMRGAPDVTNLIEHDGKIIWPTLRVQVQVLNATPGAIGFVEMLDTVAMDAWRHKSELIAALDDEINTEADDPAALTHEARQKAEAEVMGDLLDVERQEAALTWLAQSQALPVEFRPDCSPLAILQVQLITVPRATEMPGTSPGLSWPMRR